MTRVEREELLRRYLEGEMSLEQEHDFIIQAALDKELRHELKAHQTIDRAFQKDRVVDPSAYASLQATVAGMIAAPIPEAKSALASAGTRSFFTRILGKEAQRWAFGGLAGLALLGGLLMFGPEDPTQPFASPREKIVRESLGDKTPAVVPGQSAGPVQSSANSPAPLQSQLEGETQTEGGVTMERRGGAERTGNLSRRAGSSESAFSRHSGASSTTAATDSAAWNGSAVDPAASRTSTIGFSSDSALRPADDPAETADDSIGIGVRLQWKK